MLPKNFYPTPERIINQMLEGLDYRYINTILEPSAGSGNIVNTLKRIEEQENKWSRKFEFDIDCIEYDRNLRAILKENNHRVVYDDFLAYETMKTYDLIIMNPPFSNGCKHLLKALEMQKRNGGAVICILNAETLRNQCSNERITLSKELEEYGAEIKYIEDAFFDAERKTSVEIALIKVKLPETKHSSFILEGLKKAETEKENVYSNEYTQVAENDFLKSIIDQYNMEIKAGIRLINEYRAMSPYILQSFGKDKDSGETIQTGGCILSLDISTNRNKYNNKLSVNNYIKEVRGKYWKALFENPKFIGQLTNNLQLEYYNKIEELKEYDFSVYNIREIRMDMNKKVVKGIEQTIIDLFEELSNKYSYYDECTKNIHYFNGWRTNKAWIINKKVIIPLNAYDSIWNNYRPSRHEVVRKLQDIEKCFNYLDGGLTEAINMQKSLSFAEEYGETKNITLKYFDITFYKKGTCHITFTNEELLKKFNIFGCQHKGWLPPGYGKKTYKDMTTEEKDVVSAFEGEKEYNKVMENKQYYLFDGKQFLLEKEIRE